MHMQGRIKVVGLGSGDEQQISLGVWNTIKQARHLYLRTADHPVVANWLDQQQVSYKTFDHIYEAKGSFPEVYDAIADELVALALEQQSQSQSQEQEEIVYAVPGHPMIAEATVQHLIERCEGRIQLDILGGESFLDQAFLRLGFDPIAGFQLLDGSQLDVALLQPRTHTIIAQVYDNFTASDVKLGLMSLYPDDFPIVVGHALGVSGQEQIHRIPLYELDRIAGYGNLSLIWVPKTDEPSVTNKQFSTLKDIITMLRSPEGCPWDRKQTHQSIRKNLIEETYEVLETIDDDDPDAMCEELGDLLMQIMLHAEMEAELGTFNIDDVVAGLNEKLIRRHPHVFGDVQADGAEDALKTWQHIKAEEKRAKGVPEDISVLAGIPRDLPSLMKALDIQKRAAKVGFDWEQLRDVLAKLLEEYEELEEVAYHPEQIDQQADELGDVLFAIVNVARHLNIDPEAALAQTNRKFQQRFSYIEHALRLKGQQIEHTDLIEMEALWQEAKIRQRKKNL